MKNIRIAKLLILSIIFTVFLSFGSNSALGINLDPIKPVIIGPDYGNKLPSIDPKIPFDPKVPLNPNIPFIPTMPNIKFYNINYHSNFTPAAPKVVDISLTNSFVIKPADTFVHPEAFHYFVGWSTTPDGEVEYAPGDPFKIPQPVNTIAVIIDYDFDLYAKWEKWDIRPIGYSIKYHANYPDSSVTSTPIEDGLFMPGVSVITRGDGTFTNPPNYEFAGWSLKEDGAVAYYPGESIIMPSSNLKLYGVWSKKPVLNKSDHIAYIVGYPDGTFGHLRNMTRAEAVVMFSRLLTKQLVIGTKYTSTYTDVAQDMWYANAIGYMQLSNVLSTPAPHFRPDVPITRAEFADLAVGFENLTTGSASSFSDVPSSHKYYKQINYAVARGWLSGYPDGSFHPDSPITRAEVITVVNKVLERYPDYAFIAGNPSIIKNYTDLVPSYWAYFNIMEASMGHDYTKIGSTETWTSLK